MEQRFQRDKRLRFFLGDVRDSARLLLALSGVDYVLHTAALKRIEKGETDPWEFIQTNVVGTWNVLSAALTAKARRVITVSSDKAAGAHNLYGGTKFCAEKLTVQSNTYSGKTGTRFACVRYGNVAASRGSVIPKWREQAKSGCITITDERMSRFWITLPQAVQFVLSSLALMEGGEVFIPALPSVAVTDLAAAVVPGCQIETIGIQAGEKLAETLITGEEARYAVNIGDRYVILSNHITWDSHRWDDAPRLPDGWSYDSASNDWWLKGEELERLVNEV